MATIPESIQRIVEDYVRKISKQIPVKKAILFGSYVKGTFDAESDIDLAIFSDYFQNMNKTEGIYFLLLQAADYDVDLEPLAFTVQDYEEPLGIVEEILKTGIEIPLAS